MNRVQKILVGLLFVIFFTAMQGVWAQVEYSQELYAQLAQKINAIPQIKLPDYQKMVLNNGMVIYLVENHDFPIILTKGFIRWGYERETLKNAGISDLLVEMLNEQLSEGDLCRYYKLRALRFKFKVGNNNFSFAGSALSSETDALISLNYEMLCNSDFKTYYFKRIKGERGKNLKQRETKESSLINKYFYQTILKDHPYSFEHDYTLLFSNLRKLSAKSLNNYYRMAFRPNHTILFVYGDFELEEMQKKVTGFFNNWIAAETRTETVHAVENQASFGKIVLVDKADAVQAKMVMGYQFYDKALLRQDLDAKVAFKIGNRIFSNGDIGSYLMEKIRSEKGYVYDIGSSYFYNRLGGAYRINTSVKPEKAYETVVAIKQLMQDVKTGRKKITDAAVFKAINRKNAFFPEDYRHDEDIMNSLINNVELNNRKANYLNDYIKAYNHVTAATAQAALERYLFPEKLFTVIVGKKEDILPAFHEAGMEVTVITDGRRKIM